MTLALFVLALAGLWEPSRYINLLIHLSGYITAGIFFANIESVRTHLKTPQTRARAGMVVFFGLAAAIQFFVSTHDFRVLGDEPGQLSTANCIYDRFRVEASVSQLRVPEGVAYVQTAIDWRPAGFPVLVAGLHFLTHSTAWLHGFIINQFLGFLISLLLGMRLLKNQPLRFALPLTALMVFQPVIVYLATSSGVDFGNALAWILAGLSFEKLIKEPSAQALHRYAWNLMLISCFRSEGFVFLWVLAGAWIVLTLTPLQIKNLPRWNGLHFGAFAIATLPHIWHRYPLTSHFDPYLSRPLTQAFSLSNLFKNFWGFLTTGTVPMQREPFLTPILVAGFIAFLFLAIPYVRSAFQVSNDRTLFLIGFVAPLTIQTILLISFFWSVPKASECWRFYWVPSMVLAGSLGHLARQRLPAWIAWPMILILGGYSFAEDLLAIKRSPWPIDYTNLEISRVRSVILSRMTEKDLLISTRSSEHSIYQISTISTDFAQKNPAWLREQFCKKTFTHIYIAELKNVHMKEPIPHQEISSEFVRTRLESLPLNSHLTEVIDEVQWPAMRQCQT